jgi:HEAT repeat protein
MTRSARHTRRQPHAPAVLLLAAAILIPAIGCASDSRLAGTITEFNESSVRQGQLITLTPQVIDALDREIGRWENAERAADARASADAANSLTRYADIYQTDLVAAVNGSNYPDDGSRRICAVALGFTRTAQSYARASGALVAAMESGDPELTANAALGLAVLLAGWKPAMATDGGNPLNDANYERTIAACADQFQRSQSAAVQENCVIALEFGLVPGAMPQIEAVLVDALATSTETGVKVNILNLIGGLPLTSARQAVLQFAADDPEPEIRLHAVLALEAIATIDDLPMLRERLGDERPEVQAVTIGALASLFKRTGDELTIPPMIWQIAIDADDERVQIAAIQAMLKVDGIADEMTLIELLQTSQRANVRRAAAMVLEKDGVGTEACYYALISRMNDRSQAVAERCHATLQKLTGLSFGRNQRIWDDWYHSGGEGR